MSETPKPPTELGQLVLELLQRYQTEWKASLTMQALLAEKQIEVTGIVLRGIERDNGLAVDPRFQQAEAELLQGTEPQNVLRVFLAPR